MVEIGGVKEIMGIEKTEREKEITREESSRKEEEEKPAS